MITPRERAAGALVLALEADPVRTGWQAERVQRFAAHDRDLQAELFGLLAVGGAAGSPSDDELRVGVDFVERAARAGTDAGASALQPVVAWARAYPSGAPVPLIGGDGVPDAAADRADQILELSRALWVHLARASSPDRANAVLREVLAASDDPPRALRWMPPPALRPEDPLPSADRALLLQQERARAAALAAHVARLEQALDAVGPVVRLGQLTAGLAHEVNNPLGIALTAVTQVRNDVRASGMATEALEDVEAGLSLVVSNLSRAIELVQRFKAMAMEEGPGPPQPVALGPWIRELMASLGPSLRDRGVEWAVECPDDLVLRSHPGVLAEIVTNFVTNALNHAFSGNLGRTPRLTLTVRRAGTGVALVVADNGAGIPAAAASRVFDPFFTTRRGKGGMGLGLHLVRDLVTRVLGGTVELMTEEGAGTRFTVTLPQLG